MTAAAKLLRWYRVHGRDLPWRGTRDPYRILVSEIMLQQTQVARVKKFYRSWIRQFPTWKKLASATNAQVICAWAGLGYNRRALILRNVAKQILEHGTPRTEAEWRMIKGIGPYTAAAISAFTQRQRVLPIDTNIRRVLGRLILGKPFPTLLDDQKIRMKTDLFLPRRGAYNDVLQAIFDLATSICTKNPSCAICPLKRECKAAALFLSGRVKIPKRSILSKGERLHRNKPYPDRIYRGRILKLVRERGRVWILDIGPLVDPTFNKKFDQEWIRSMIDRLVRDELVSQQNRRLILPNL